MIENDHKLPLVPTPFAAYTLTLKETPTNIEDIVPSIHLVGSEPNPILTLEPKLYAVVLISGDDALKVTVPVSTIVIVLLLDMV